MAGNFAFAGAVAAASISARSVCMKTYGGCPAMPSPGSARIVETKMGLGINKREVQGSRFSVQG